MEVQGLWEVVLPRLQRSVGAGLKIDDIAEHCHVSVDTVHGWVENKHPAKGEKMIRLWHLLAFVGNDSPELETLHPLQRLVSELVGFDIIGPVMACDIFNTSPEKISHVYHILRGAEALKPKYSYEQVLADHSGELTQMKELMREQLAVDVVMPEPKEVQDEPTTMQATMLLDGNPKYMLASLVGAILPLARALLSDDFTPEDRSQFRESVSSETLFDITNALNALSSERARKADK